jgi:Na+-transporting methylmalonyl-CoA/oxaloacetate decarboxylase gamma subunit
VYILILIGVAMLSSFLTLLLHCCLIVGKESDKYWEEETITKKEDKEE